MREESHWGLEGGRGGFGDTTSWRNAFSTTTETLGDPGQGINMESSVPKFEEAK